MSEYNESKDKIREHLRQYTYYYIIGIASLIVLFFVPFLGSTIGLGLSLPNTTAGWIVWVVVKVIVAAINVLIFHSFMQQAKLNVKDDEHYVEGKKILGKIKRKEYIPRSPEKWNAQQYGRKGTMIVITTGLATVALTQAILVFDWVSMLAYLFTIILGLVCGILQMKSAEAYWTEEFWKYAKMIEEKQIEEDNKKAAESNENTTENKGEQEIVEEVKKDIHVEETLESVTENKGEDNVNN